MKPSIQVCAGVVALAAPLLALTIPFSRGDVYDSNGNKTGTYSMNGSNIYDFSNPPDSSTWLYNIITQTYDQFTSPAINDYRFIYTEITDPPVPMYPHRWEKQQWVYDEEKEEWKWETIETGTFRNNV